MKARLRGFSLVELLVVIAIIVVIVSMMLPGIQRVRETSKVTACKNNMRQIGIAWHNYASTNGTSPGDISPWNTYRVGTSRCSGWPTKLMPYMEIQSIEVTPGLYMCPSRAMNGLVAIDYSGGNALNSAMRMERITDIRDGASNTLLLGERFRNLSDSKWVIPDDGKILDPDAGYYYSGIHQVNEFGDRGRMVYNDTAVRDYADTGLVFSIQLGARSQVLADCFEFSFLTIPTTRLPISMGFIINAKDNSSFAHSQHALVQSAIQRAYNNFTRIEVEILAAAVSVDPTAAIKFYDFGFGSCHLNAMNILMADGAARNFRYGAKGLDGLVISNDGIGLAD